MMGLSKQNIKKLTASLARQFYAACASLRGEIAPEYTLPDGTGAVVKFSESKKAKRAAEKALARQQNDRAAEVNALQDALNHVADALPTLSDDAIAEDPVEEIDISLSLEYLHVFSVMMQGGAILSDWVIDSRQNPDAPETLEGKILSTVEKHRAIAPCFNNKAVLAIAVRSSTLTEDEMRDLSQTLGTNTFYIINNFNPKI